MPEGPAEDLVPPFSPLEPLDVNCAHDVPVPIRHGYLSKAYEVAQVVGRGGYATVHRATRRTDNATVAVKLIKVRLSIAS